MQFISDPSLPGQGDITGLYLNRDRSVVAVTSQFRLLTNPPARASYGGQRLRYRVALYHPPETKPFAVLDSLRYSVNDVAFHPSEPTIAIATGSYDGGWAFEGELVVWDWEGRRHSNKTGPIPEVVRCSFSDAGSSIIALVRPWDEGSDDLGDPFDSFYEIWATYSGDFFEGEFDSSSIAQQISQQIPLSEKDIESNPRFSSQAEHPEPTLQQVFKLDGFKFRSPIWDVAWLGNGGIGIVHDDCQLEVLDSKGVHKRSFVGFGHGVQIFARPNLLVHAVQYPRASLYSRASKGWDDACSSRLLRFDGTELRAVADFKGQFTYSVSRDGWVLGRRDRTADRTPAEKDVIGDPSLGVWCRYDFGHYDVFNHFLRVDDSPYLFLVQGSPPTSHEHKHVCVVSHDGSVRQLWSILPETRQHSGHAMECAFGYLADSFGEGLIASGYDLYSNSQQPYPGFIYRKRLEDGKELWRHDTKASATAIKAIPGHEVILAAFLNGEVAAIESGSGAILEWTEFRPDGDLSVVFSFDVFAERIIFGAIDGRVGILPVSILLNSGIN